MTGLLGASVLWRIARRLVAPALIAGLAIAVVTPDRQLSDGGRQLRHHVRAELHQARRDVAHALETRLPR